MKQAKTKTVKIWLKYKKNKNLKFGMVFKEM